MRNHLLVLTCQSCYLCSGVTPFIRKGITVIVNQKAKNLRKPLKRVSDVKKRGCSLIFYNLDMPKSEVTKPVIGQNSPRTQKIRTRYFTSL